jgi:hypothetical protein
MYYTLTIPDGSQARIQFGLTTSYGTYTWWVPARAQRPRSRQAGSRFCLMFCMLPRKAEVRLRIFMSTVQRQG